MDKKLRVFVTGASGYLASMLIQKLAKDTERVEYLSGVDARETKLNLNTYRHVQNAAMILNQSYLKETLKRFEINTLVHAAWMFNPSHDCGLQRDVDVKGSENVFESAKRAGVENIIYVGSATAYGAVTREPKLIKEHEQEEIRGEECSYLYSRHKAIVDKMFTRFARDNPQIRCVLIRGAIVAGSNTRNIVSQMAGLPAMVGIRRYDPPMQFLSEEDMTEILYLSVVRPEISGVFNAAGDGTLNYSEVAGTLGKRCLFLPESIIYPAVSFGWKYRLLPFPPSILDLVKYPWLGDNSNIKKEFKRFGFKLRHSSEDAIRMLAEGLRRNKNGNS